MVSCHAFNILRNNILKELSFRIENSQKKLDYSGITFPVTIKQIPQIERQNQININLFGIMKRESFQLEFLQKIIMIT